MYFITILSMNIDSFCKSLAVPIEVFFNIFLKIHVPLTVDVEYIIFVNMYMCNDRIYIIYKIKFRSLIFIRSYFKTVLLG